MHKLRRLVGGTAHLSGVVHVCQVKAQGGMADAAERFSELGRRHRPALTHLCCSCIFLALPLCTLGIGLFTYENKRPSQIHDLKLEK